MPYELTLITSNLPSGYHRDLQLLKEGLIPAIQNLKSCLEIFTFSLESIQVNDDIIKDSKYDYLFTVEEVNELVQKGTPFRDAYKIVGEKVEKGEFKPNKQVKHEHIGSIGNLALDQIQEKMNKALVG